MATASNFPSSTSAHGQPAADAPNAGAAGVAGGLRADWLVRVLGALSAGTAVPQLLTPGAFRRAIGIGDGPRQGAATAVVGVREVAAAVGLLRWPSPVWLWARVGGDVMDLTLLGLGLKSPNNYDKRRTAAAIAAAVGIAGVDVYAAATRSPRRAEMRLSASVTVAIPAIQAYELWRRLEVLPSFMAQLDEVTMTGPATSHWRASAPLRTTVAWGAQLHHHVARRRLALRVRHQDEAFREVNCRFKPVHPQ